MAVKPVRMAVWMLCAVGLAACGPEEPAVPPGPHEEPPPRLVPPEPQAEPRGETNAGAAEDRLDQMARDFRRGAEQAGQRVGEAAEEFAQTTRDERQQFRGWLNQQLDRAEVELEQLQREAAERGEQVRPEVERRLAEINQRMADLRRRAEAASDDTREAWEDLTQDVAYRYRELRRDMEDAGQRVREGDSPNAPPRQEDPPGPQSALPQK